MACDVRAVEPRAARADSQAGRASLGLVVLLAVTFLAFCNYAAMLSVVPLWAARSGAASWAVGATTGTMMLATVATQLAMPWLFRLLSLRAMAILGAVMLGAPTPLYLLSAEILPVLALTVARGVGFGFVVMAGATLLAELAREGRLATSASLYGTAAALPNLAALAGGVWLAQTWGFGPVFWGAGIAPIAAGVLAIALPNLRGSFAPAGSADVRSIAWPVGLFLFAAGAFGAVTTFLPVAVRDPRDASPALLVASMALVVGRLAAGAVGNRRRPGRLLLAAMLSCAAGLAVIAGSLGGGVALLLGAALLGAGFGVAQNDSFVAVVCRLGPNRRGTASTIWNIAYDGGLGLGAVALGWAIAGAGYVAAFACLAGSGVVLAVCLTRLRPASPRPCTAPREE